METLLLRDRPEDIQRAGDILRRGGLVAIPTETVYGLAANALDPAAVVRIFAVKGRPQDNPLIVHIADVEELTTDIAVMDDRTRRLADTFWPGPLTLVLPRGSALPDVTTAGLDSVGVRVPAHEAARAVIRAAGVPVAAPSANQSGSPSPTTAQHCMDDLSGRVEAILDGGACEVGIESTVLSLTGDIPVVLRPGAVTAEAVSRALGGVSVALAPSIFEPVHEGETVASPGMKYRHYAPRVHLALIKSDFAAFADYIKRVPEGSGALVFEGEAEGLAIPATTYGRRGDPESQAGQLFDALRHLDDMGVQRVFVRAPDTSGIGLGVYNRLLRAASFEVIELV